MRPAHFMLTIAIASCQCRTGGLSPDEGALVAAPSVVEFPQTFVGYPTRASVNVNNTGRRPRDVTLQAPAPFSTELSSLEIEGQSASDLELEFAATAPGTFERTLALTSDTTRLEVVLRGTALEVPSCPPLPCKSSHFDVTARGCVTTPVDDGLACTLGSDACLVDGQCQQGQCVGRARDCDDHDLCTADVCEPARGCVHFAATAQCPASTNACQVPTCVAGSGCGFADVVDGTSCGSADCSTANVCINGSCRTVRPPDGARCGQNSPCQPEGRCEHDVCVQAAPTELRPAWTISAEDRSVIWDSIADWEGNLYWREASNGAQRLVSSTIDGRPRFTVPIGSATQSIVLVENTLLLRSEATLEARSSATGTPRWFFDFRAGADGGTARVMTISRGPPGSVYIGVTFEPSFSTVFLMRLASGDAQWWVPFPQSALPEELPVDEVDYLYGGVERTDGTRRYFALSPTGNVRWDVVNPHADPAAVFGGRIYHWDHWLSDSRTGMWVNDVPPQLAIFGFPRLALGAISYAASETVAMPACDDPSHSIMATRLELRRVDPQSSRVLWAVELAGRDAGQEITNTILTSRNSVLFSQREARCDDSAYVLREISAQGTQSFSCRLPAPQRYVGLGLLTHQKWISAVSTAVDGGVPTWAVRAFNLPGFELPASGWATAWGSNARDSHCR